MTQGRDHRRRPEGGGCRIGRSRPMSLAAVGPVAQWLEPAAHNGLVGGSSPPGPTIFKGLARAFVAIRAQMFTFVHAYHWSIVGQTLQEKRGGASFGTRGSQVQILPLRPSLSSSQKPLFGQIPGQKRCSEWRRQTPIPARVEVGRPSTRLRRRG
jgi:hypothetical protein